MNDKIALIIDDELDICMLLTGLLKQMGIKATFATSIMEGKEKLAVTKYYMLFLDNNLPDGFGIDLLPEIKSKYPDLHVMMISAHDGEKERVIAADRGAFGFIGKPFTKSKIINSLRVLYPNIPN